MTESLSQTPGAAPATIVWPDQARVLAIMAVAVLQRLGRGCD